MPATRNRRNLLKLSLAAVPSIVMLRVDDPLRRVLVRAGVGVRVSDVRLTPRKASDRATGEVEGDGGLRVVVDSPSGIGGLTMERGAGAVWPKRLTIRLKVRGLERFRLHDAVSGLTLTAAVSTTDGTLSVTRSRAAAGESERAVEPGSDEWLEVRGYDSAGRPSERMPNGLGAVEIEVPASMLTQEARTLSVEWVDFFRN